MREMERMGSRSSRKQTFGDFMDSSGSSQSQSSKIEWSNSEDEEDEAFKFKSKESKAHKSTVSAKKLHCVFPHEFKEITVKKKLQVVKVSPKLQADSAIPSTAGRSSFVAVKDTKGSCTPFLIGTKLHNAPLQPKEKTVIPNSTSDATAIDTLSPLKVIISTLKTPTKEKCGNTSQDIIPSPIIGSQHKHFATRKTRTQKSQIDCNENDYQAPSPILGTSNIAKASDRPVFPILGTIKRQVRTCKFVRKMNKTLSSDSLLTEDSSPPIGSRKSTKLNPTTVNTSPTIGTRRNIPTQRSDIKITKRYTLIPAISRKSIIKITQRSTLTPTKTQRTATERSLKNISSPAIIRRPATEGRGKNTLTPTKTLSSATEKTEKNTSSPIITRRTATGGRGKNTMSPTKSQRLHPIDARKHLTVSPTISRKRIGETFEGSEMEIKRRMKPRNLCETFSENYFMKPNGKSCNLSCQSINNKKELRVPDKKEIIAHSRCTSDEEYQDNEIKSIESLSESLGSKQGKVNSKDIRNPPKLHNCIQLTQDVEDQEIRIQSMSSSSSQTDNKPLVSIAKQSIPSAGFSTEFPKEKDEYVNIETQSSPTQSDSQFDNKIEQIDLSFRNTQNMSEKSCDESGEPSISVVSPEEEIVEGGEALKTGSNWLKNLQQRTPEKPSNQEEREKNAESTKKKGKKDGHAARLKRFLKSWQSEVQIWNHQMSSEVIPETKRLKIEEKTVTLLSPGSVKNLIKKELHCENPNKEIISPHSLGIRNLHNAWIESHQESPGVSDKSKIVTARKKNVLTVKVLPLDKSLPINATLCEALSDGIKFQQESIKAESHCTNRNLVVKKKYLVFFNSFDKRSNTALCVGDQVEIHSPWQVLDIPGYDIPVLFTSYYILNKESNMKTQREGTNEESSKRKPSPQRRKVKKKIVLMRWSCSCIKDSSILPSMCKARYKQTNPGVTCINNTSELHKPNFRVVKDFSQELKQDETSPAGTVLEAIEKCGGISEKQVTLSIRAHRVISCSNSNGKIEEWEVLGQDASGIFCTVKIPNRPLVQQLKKVIEEGEGTTWTLTQLNVIERVTNTQNPALFSLISSLHRAYKKALKDDPILFPILSDHASSTSQTYCYVFTVNLGNTEILDSNREVVIPVSLPKSTLQGMLELPNNGQRFSINLNMLYKVGSYLYVINQRDEGKQNGTPDQYPVHNAQSEEVSPKGFIKENTIIAKISISPKATLPDWIPKIGTVMVNADVRDTVRWHDGVMIDEYSVIQLQNNAFEMCLLTLVRVVDSLSPSSKIHDLVVVVGTITKVDSKTASTWLSCGNCGSPDVEEKENNRGLCLACGQDLCELVTEYYMEVWISCGSPLTNSEVKVKLCQRLIKKLLLQCQEVDEGYDEESLVGKRVGPMVCVLEEVKRLKRSQPINYKLLQLPY